MPTFPDFDEAHVAVFRDTVDTLTAQMTPYVAGYTAQQSASGEQFQAANFISNLDPSELSAPTYNGSSYDGWYGDTVWDSVEHTQRWITPTTYKSALPINKNDLVQSLTDPKSAYARSIVGGMNRQRDDIVIAAALGSATTGKYDSLSTQALPSAQKLTRDGAVTVEDKLSLAKLLDAWELLRGDEVTANGMGSIYFVTNAFGLRSLLDEEKLTSADYATVKALVAGELDSFLGFTFLRSERITSTVNAGAGNYDTIHNFAFAEDGIMEGMWQNMTIRADERPDKNYTWQIYSSMMCGAVRTEDVKVVQVDTSAKTVNT